MKEGEGHSSLEEDQHSTSGGERMYFVRKWGAYEWSSKTQVILIALIIFTFLVTFTPSEAYLVPFLTRLKPFTEKQVSIDIFPFGVYATLFIMLLAAPACHFLSYRSFIIIGTFGKLATFVILYYTESLFIMQLSQITYGLGMTSNLVLSSYIFLLVPEQDYQVVTSYTQASSFISYLLAAELGQFLVDGGISLVILLQITLIFTTSACVMSFFLPRESTGSRQWGVLISEPGAQQQGPWEMIRETWKGRNLQLLSFWWVFGTAGFAMILNYSTNLFDEIDPTTNTYGHITAASQGAGSLGALLGIRVSPLAARGGGTVYVIGTFSSGLLCVIMSWSKTLWVVYPTFVATIGINQLLLCLIYVQCAISLSNRKFILLFSFNTAAALIIQSAIQGVVEILQLSTVDQFYVYGGYCMTLAVVFLGFCYKNYSKTGTLTLVPVAEESSSLL